MCSYKRVSKLSSHFITVKRPIPLLSLCDLTVPQLYDNNVNGAAPLNETKACLFPFPSQFTFEHVQHLTPTAHVFEQLGFN
jgi:hypothetical protein